MTGSGVGILKKLIADARYTVHKCMYKHMIPIMVTGKHGEGNVSSVFISCQFINVKCMNQFFFKCRYILRSVIDDKTLNEPLRLML